MGNKRNGLLALLGLGAVAYWKYKNSSDDEKQAVMDKLNAAKDNFGKLTNDVKSKANEVAKQVQDKAQEVKSNVEESVNQG